MFLVIALVIPAAFFGWRRAQTDLTRAANTDSLTGLGNRRRLALKLEEVIPTATVEQPVLLAMFDLDGFKLYNDSYGHPAGDALLVRLSRSLTDGLAGTAVAYRMGGDEFCVVAQLSTTGEGFHVAAQAADALSEHGEGFTRARSRLSASRQTTDVLLQMTAERNAELGEHVTGVTRLSTSVATRLGLSAEQIDAVARASAARHRQARDPGSHPREARAAHRRGMGIRPATHRHR
jgi:diguanylate cyclase (GGDEF)-like protein